MSDLISICKIWFSQLLEGQSETLKGQNWEEFHLQYAYKHHAPCRLFNLTFFCLEKPKDPISLIWGSWPTVSMRAINYTMLLSKYFLWRDLIKIQTFSYLSF